MDSLKSSHDFIYKKESITAIIKYHNISHDRSLNTEPRASHASPVQATYKARCKKRPPPPAGGGPAGPAFINC